jgi:hypothetical protein
VGHNNLALVRSVMWLLAADRGRAASIDSKFKMEDRMFNAGRVETIPMGFDDGNNSGTNGWSNIGADDKVLFELREVAFAVPKVDVGVRVRERSRGMTNRFAITLKKEDTLVNIITVVHWDITIGRFGAPYLGRHINDKDGRRAGKRERSGGDGRVSSRGSRR